MTSIKSHIAQLVDGRDLDEAAAYDAFSSMVEGTACDAQIGGLLMALRTKGETVDEIVGGARALRDKVKKIDVPGQLIDTCGTGGDAKGSFNISTAAALVAAACGAKVAKHGNRAQTSQSGSADVLAALGLNLEAPLSACQRALEQAGVCFLMAPRHHEAMRHVAPARRALGVRSLFNLIGPLTNPAGATHQLLGVFASEWVKPMAEALKRLGSQRAWVVHGGDGLDEITLSQPTQVAELDKGTIRCFSVAPEDAGLARCPTQSLAGGDGAHNAHLMRQVLAGDRGPLRDVTLINAAAVLVVAGLVPTLKAGVARAGDAIDRGQATRTLDALVAASL